MTESSSKGLFAPGEDDDEGRRTWEEDAIAGEGGGLGAEIGLEIFPIPPPFALPGDFEVT